MAMYSHSKLSTFEQCKLRYRLRYIDKIKPPIKGSIEGHLGTSVHNALEWLYKEVMKDKLPSIENLLEEYIENWQKEFSEELVIVKRDKTAKDYFDKGVKFLTDYYFKHHPFKDGTIETEKKIYIKIKDTNHLLMGYIDRLVYNEEKNYFEIHDYKTANSLPNQSYFDKDRQLALYSIAIKEKYQKDVLAGVYTLFAPNTFTDVQQGCQRLLFCLGYGFGCPGNTCGCNHRPSSCNGAF